MVSLGFWSSLTSLPNPCDPTYSSSLSCFHCSADSPTTALPWFVSLPLYVSISFLTSYQLTKPVRPVTPALWHWLLKPQHGELWAFSGWNTLKKKHRSHVCRGHNAEEKGSAPSVHPHLHLKSAFIAALRVCQSQRGFVHCHITWLNRSWHWHLPLEVGYLAEEERRGKSLMNSSHGVPLS